MNKTAIIVGVLALAGVGAYFYLKPKKTSETPKALGGLSGLGSSVADTETTSTTPVPSSGTTLSTPQQVEDVAKKIAEAKSLATKIFDLRNKRNSYMIMSLKDFAVASNNTFFLNKDLMLKALRDNEIRSIENSIKSLDEQLGKLGYMEVNGSIVKIV